jgi:hypothetical protein
MAVEEALRRIDPRRPKSRNGEQESGTRLKRLVSAGAVDLLFDNLIVITSILIFSQFRTGFENGYLASEAIQGSMPNREVCLFAR